MPPILTSLRTVINTANAQGVALIAIKGLNRKLKAELASRDQDIATLKAMIRQQGTQISSLESPPNALQ